jgi:hypothetical protein
MRDVCEVLHRGWGTFRIVEGFTMPERLVVCSVVANF